MLKVSCNLPTVVYKSLDASGASVFLNLLGAAEGALIRAAASSQTFGRFAAGIIGGHIRACRQLLIATKEIL